MPDIDRIDRKILDILQRQGRIAMTELATQIGLSTSPCTERVRRLERDGVITGYHAHLSPEAALAQLTKLYAGKLRELPADVSAPRLGSVWSGAIAGADLRCPSNFAFQRAALMPPWVAEQLAR